MNAEGILLVGKPDRDASLDEILQYVECKSLVLERTFDAYHALIAAVGEFEIVGDSAKGLVRPYFDERLMVDRVYQRLGGNPTAKATPIILPFSAVEPGHIDWLWEERIPRGHVTVLYGPGGVGKSTLACEIAARLSRGQPLPGHAQTDVVRSLFMVSEDGDSMARNRLEAAGADLRDGVFLLVGHGDPEEPKIVSVAQEDYPQIREAVKQTGVGLLIVDAFTDHMAPGTNDRDEMAVRRILSPLQRFVRELDVSLLAIAHTPKGVSMRAADEALIGSVAYRDVARSLLMVGYTTENKDGPRAIAPAKSNYAAHPATIEFSIESVPPNASRVKWGGERSDLDADDLNPAATSSEERSAVDEAADFLSETLKGGPKPSKDVVGDAKKEGISDRTLRRARRQLGVISEHIGTSPGHWQLRLLEQGGQGAQEGQGWPPCEVQQAQAVSEPNKARRPTNIVGPLAPRQLEIERTSGTCPSCRGGMPANREVCSTCASLHDQYERDERAGMFS